MMVPYGSPERTTSACPGPSPCQRSTPNAAGAWYDLWAHPGIAKNIGAHGMPGWTPQKMMWIYGWIKPHNISTYMLCHRNNMWSIITFPILWWTSIWGRARHISSFAPKPGCFCRWCCWSWWCLWPSKLLLCFAFRYILLTLAVRFFWGGQTNST